MANCDGRSDCFAGWAAASATTNRTPDRTETMHSARQLSHANRSTIDTPRRASWRERPGLGTALGLVGGGGEYLAEVRLVPRLDRSRAHRRAVEEAILGVPMMSLTRTHVASIMEGCRSHRPTNRHLEDRHLHPDSRRHRHRRHLNSRRSMIERDGATRRQPNGRPKHDVAQVVLMVPYPGCCDVRRHGESRDSDFPPVVATENRRARKRPGCVPRRKRGLTIAVWACPPDGQLDELGESPARSCARTRSRPSSATPGLLAHAPIP